MTQVLIVEDNEENRNLLRMLLEANTYKVTVAGDGLEALAVARRDPPDVVVSDVLMPKMDGFALCRAWIQDAALKAIPFIFYSATYVRTDDEQFAKALGSVAYLPKPLEAEVFLRELRALVQQWAGHAVPATPSPLDDSAFHTLHESALARTIEDKIAQLEAANRRLQESEARFRSLTEMSSDYFWESDAEHRITHRTASSNPSAMAVQQLFPQIGKRRWEVPFLSPDEAEWQAHRAVLDAHQPFRNFELSRLGVDGVEHFASISGDPVFDAPGSFTGYRGVGTDITERRRGEETLRRFNTAMNAITDAIYLVDRASMRFIHINDAACRMRKQTREEMFALGPEGVLSTTREELEHIYDQIIAGGGVAEPLELQRTRADGSQVWLELRRHAQRSGNGWTIVTLVRDITDRKAAEATILRFSQLYAALSHSNAAIARSGSEAELAWEICRIAVRYGGISMAWIGLVDPNTRAIRPAASFGEHAVEFLHNIKLSVDADSPYGRGPVGISIRENRPEWFQDFQNDPRAAPWHKDSRRFGWRSALSLPLRRNRVPIGALVLYAVDASVFELAVRKLLIEMTSNIDFALDNFAREATRTRAEQDLRAAEEQFRGLVEQPIAGIFIIQDDKLAYVNPRFAEIFGYACADELIGRESLSLVVDKERSAVLDMRRKIESSAQSMDYGFTAARKDGTPIEIGVHGARATHKSRPAVIGMVQDVSEKKRAEEQVQRYLEQLKTAFMSTVEVATTLSEMRDPHTAGHERHVGEIAAALGTELGLDEQRIEGLRVAGFLHDIGKTTIPVEILSKPGKLSPIEYELIKGHPQSGYDVLKDVKSPWPVAEIALQHHERIDGSGYPQGLKGDAILLEARIMAVADVMEAMSSYRPYRAKLGVDAALGEIERGRGTSYDSAVVDACLRLFRERGYRLPE